MRVKAEIIENGKVMASAEFNFEKTIEWILHGDGGDRTMVLKLTRLSEGR